MKIASKVLFLAFGISIAAWAQQPTATEFQVETPVAAPAVADSMAQPTDTTQFVQPVADSAITATPAEVAATDSVPADSQAVATDSAAVVDTTAAAPADTAKPDTVAAVAPDTTARDTVQPVAEQPKADSAIAPATVALAPADTSATAKPVETEPEIETPLSKILHGNAYNLVGNEAAAATVAGELGMPHHMANRNFAYFEPIDEEGVGQLVQMAVEKGRKTRPNIKLGICGEHGGDPATIDFCHRVGLTYVSCSPFRVPIARLAAAQAAVRNA